MWFVDNKEYIEYDQTTHSMYLFNGANYVCVQHLVAISGTASSGSPTLASYWLQIFTKT